MNFATLISYTCKSSQPINYTHMQIKRALGILKKIKDSMMLAYLKREAVELKGRIEFHEEQLASDIEKRKTATWKRSIAELEGRIQFSQEQIPRDRQKLEEVLAKIAEIKRGK